MTRIISGTLPVTVKRNAYGRQLGSFEATARFDNSFDFTMTFIRAPYVEAIDASAKNDVRVLAEYDGKIVGVQYKNQIGLAFHPELDDDTRIHERFLEMISGNLNHVYSLRPGQMSPDFLYRLFCGKI